MIFIIKIVKEHFLYISVSLHVLLMFTCSLDTRHFVLKSWTVLCLNRKGASASQSVRMMNSTEPFLGAQKSLCEWNQHVASVGAGPAGSRTP